CRYKGISRCLLPSAPPKTREYRSERGIEPVARGAAHVVTNKIKRTATHYARGVAYQDILDALLVFLVVVQPLRTAPLPHIPQHISRPTPSVSDGKEADRCFAADACVMHVAVLLWISLITPWIDPSIGVTGGSLPLRLARQANFSVSLLRKPDAERHRFMPTHPYLWMVRC